MLARIFDITHFRHNTEAICIEIYRKCIASQEGRYVLPQRVALESNALWQHVMTLLACHRKCSQNSMPINRKSLLNESRLNGFYVIFINGKDFFIVVLKKTIWKITIFLDFCRKMRKVIVFVLLINIIYDTKHAIGV